MHFKKYYQKKKLRSPHFLLFKGKGAFHITSTSRGLLSESILIVEIVGKSTYEVLKSRNIHAYSHSTLQMTLEKIFGRFRT